MRETCISASASRAPFAEGPDWLAKAVPGEGAALVDPELPEDHILSRSATGEPLRPFTTQWLSLEAIIALIAPGHPKQPQGDVEGRSVADPPDFDCLRRIRSAGYLVRWDRESGRLDDYFASTLYTFDGLSKVPCDGPKDLNGKTTIRNLRGPSFLARDPRNGRNKSSATASLPEISLRAQLEIGATSVESSAERQRERWLELAGVDSAQAPAKESLEAAVRADWEVHAQSAQPGAEQNSFSARFLALSSTTADDLRKLWLPDSGTSDAVLSGPAFLDLSRVSTFYVMTLSLVDGRFEDVESGRPALVTVAGLVSTRPAWDDAKYLFDRLGELCRLGPRDKPAQAPIRAEASAALASGVQASAAFVQADISLSEDHLKRLVARRVTRLGLDSHDAFLPTAHTWLLGRTAIGGVLGRRAEELTPELWLREVGELRELLEPLSQDSAARLKSFLRWVGGLRETCIGALRERRDRIVASQDLMEEQRAAVAKSLCESVHVRGTFIDASKALIRTLREHIDHRLRAIQGSSSPWRVRPGREGLVNLCQLEELPPLVLRATLAPLWPSRPPRALADAVLRRLAAELPPALLRLPGDSPARLRHRLRVPRHFPVPRLIMTSHHTERSQHKYWSWLDRH